MTRGRENPACSITETGKRADSVRMLHSHHSPGTRLANPEAPAVKREAEEDWTAMRVIHSAQFELSVEGVPRSYRNRKDIALQSAQILKFRNPNSVVRLNDLKTGAEIVIAFKAAQQ